MKIKLSMNLTLILILQLFILNTSYAGNCNKNIDVIVIHDHTIKRSEKEAILILPGLGDSKKGRKAQKAYFGNNEYDLFIPDYIEKNSYNESLDKFSIFFKKQNLNEYKKIHVFSYILGSWIINSFINKEGIGNISSIVYDRSPIQERAPIIVHENIPRIGKMLKGNLLKELSTIDYPPIEQESINIGIVVESTATSLMRHFKKETLEKGEINWSNLNFNQTSTDLMFTKLNHDEMYIDFTITGAEILNFFRTGSFSTSAQRKWFEWDPFSKKN